MEAFSLLKYWKAGGAPAAADTTAAILSAAAQNDYETTDDEDGPFFDLEFEEEEEDSEDDAPENPNDDESEREFNLTLSPSSSSDRTENPDLPLSPSDDLFFKGNLVQLEPLNASEPNPKPQFTASLLKSATKFRAFRLGLKKSKSNLAASGNSKHTEIEQKQRKLFTVKFKVEEAPIVSLFTRDNSSKGNKSSQKQKQHNTEESQVDSPSSASDEKRFSKEVMQKYLKMVKPLYIRVSQKYAEKLRFSGQLNVPPPSQKPSPAKEAVEKVQIVKGASEKEGNSVKGKKQGTLPLHAGLRVVCKHLGKSRSASTVEPPAAADDVASSRRRDDSLLQQEDGIQSAILHCKRSFNAPRECDSSQLPESVSDPLHEKGK